MTEAEPDEVVQVVDVENDRFTSAVRQAVKPLVIGLAVLVAAVFLAGGIAVGALVIQSNDIIQSRSEGQVRTCGSDQYFEIHHNALAQADRDVWSTALADNAKTKPASERPAIKIYAEVIESKYESTEVPVRACSPAAIRAYIKWRTEHPTGVDCDSDAHGYCKTPPVSTP